MLTVHLNSCEIHAGPSAVLNLSDHRSSSESLHSVSLTLHRVGLNSHSIVANPRFLVGAPVELVIIAHSVETCRGWRCRKGTT